MILMGIKSDVLFWYMLLYSAYISWMKQLKSSKVHIVVGTDIVVVGAMTHCPLLNFVRDLKPAQMNV